MLLINHTYVTIVKQFFPMGNSINYHVWLYEIQNLFHQPLSFIIISKKKDQFPNMINNFHNELIKTL
jgi:hypothetical protein